MSEAPRASAPPRFPVGNVMDTERPLAESKALLNAIYCVECTSYDEFGDQEDHGHAVREMIVMIKDRLTIVERLIFGEEASND